MKRLLCALLVLSGALSFAASASEQDVNCAPAVPCTTSGPSATGTGDPAYVSFGKLNGDVHELYGDFAALNVLINSNPVLAGTNISITGVWPTITIGTLGVPTINGTITPGHCASWFSTTALQDAGACGGGSSAFSALTGGTNASAAMVIGTGASLTTSGSGTIAATNTTGVNGAAVPTSAAVVASNSLGQLIAGTTTGSGSAVVLQNSPALTTPNLGTPSAVNLSNATALPCGAMPALTGAVTSSSGSCATTQSDPTVTVKNAAYQFVLTDDNSVYQHSDGTARTYTVPANSGTPFNVGACIEADNLNGAAALTIAITTDTLRWPPTGSTGSRTVTAPGFIILCKKASTEWWVQGGANITDNFSLFFDAANDPVFERFDRRAAA